MKFRIVLKPDIEDGGYNVSCPALTGCHSQGDSIDEAVLNIQEAIELCLEVLNERAAKSIRPNEQILEVVL
ncbi:type II toxin-antitoxin system HicB family antitoxin [Desulfobacter sp.]|uniref:type II toxin-antitoxin system HicB family antitoxin n=1 Tax=Desulfobacter sp. TaxID=2294 RepID=UPI003D109701